jgi:uncharacterized protein with NAD-binding domain and iron-sulfur cluster
MIGMGKKRVAILGGGVSAMTTAFWLTSYPGWKDDWEIDVYQMGWRLGGKGASGRNPHHHQRIEEHGLHIFLGFYDNAFKTMQRLYGELGRGPKEPLARWDQAWTQRSHVVFMEKPQGHWLPWSVEFPTNDLVPGVGEQWPPGWDYVKMLIEWIRQWMERLGVLPTIDPVVVDEVVGGVYQSTTSHPGVSGERRVVTMLSEFAENLIERAIQGVGRVASLTDIDNQLIYAAIRLASDLGTATHPDSRHGAVARLIGRLRAWVWERVHPVLRSNADARRAFIMIDLAAAIISGMVADDLIGPEPYWFKIDDVDFRTWIKKHGAEDITAQSAPIAAAYALPFHEEVEIGAGTGLHGLLRMMLGYKGSLFWEMQAGMGDTIFAPFHDVLSRRGVRFHYFHRVDRLELSADKKRVARVHIGRQVNLKHGPYRPLVDVKGLPCWPSEPLFDQLVEGDELAASGCDLEDWWTTWQDRGTPLVLEDGEHYDVVVLGTAIGTFPYIAAEVIAAEPRFKAMVDHVAHTQTQALQLWLRPDLRGMGWPLADRPPPVVGAYALWLDTVADMTHLVPREDWPAGREPGHLAYLCGRLADDEPLPPRSDHGYPGRQHARVRASALEFLRRHAGTLWPGSADANDPRSINWYHLVDDQERAGEARFEAQFIRGVLNPSERYVLSKPGTSRYRLRAEETGIDNLLHVGDHTFTGVNAGCVEAAVMSGMNAAQQLCGHPGHIVGDVLPRRDD